MFMARVLMALARIYCTRSARAARVLMALAPLARRAALFTRASCG
jgi:hypothetical protein